MIVSKQTTNNLLCCDVFNYEDIYASLNSYSAPMLVFKNLKLAEDYCKQVGIDIVYFRDYNEFLNT